MPLKSDWADRVQNNALRALSHGIDREKIVMPPDVASIGFLNAESVDFDFAKIERIKCEQPLRQHFLQLQQNGHEVEPCFNGKPESFDAALVLLTKHRRYNEILIGRASRMVSQFGVIFVTGEIKSGAVSFEKWLAKNTQLIGGYSKFHSRVCWFSNNQKPDFEDVSLEHEIRLPEGYTTEEGMFSAHEIDKGSEFLASHFDERIKGDVADFGAGWGYLSDQLLENSGKIKSLDLYESDWRALRRCSGNIKNGQGIPVSSHWLDLENEAVSRQYDWIIMNPPFHSGKNRREDLGQAFIFKASACLRRGGKLLMVANTKLPYERVLNEAFFKVEKREQRDGYKIIEAMK